MKPDGAERAAKRIDAKVLRYVEPVSAEQFG
jgi:hypothetical protein